MAPTPTTSCRLKWKTSPPHLYRWWGSMKKSLENDDEAENTIHFVRKEIAQVSKELSEVDDLILDRAVKYVKAINSKKLIYKLPIKPNHNMLEALFGDSSEVEDLETHATANESIITATHRGKMHPGCGVEKHRQSLSPISFSPDSYQMGDVRMIGQNLNLRQIPQNSTPRIPQIAPPPRHNSRHRLNCNRSNNSYNSNSSCNGKNSNYNSSNCSNKNRSHCNSKCNN